MARHQSLDAGSIAIVVARISSLFRREPWIHIAGIALSILSRW
jgi:hypothetical protein